MSRKRILLSILTLVCALSLAIAPCFAQETAAPKKKGGKRGKGKKARVQQQPQQGQEQGLNTLTAQEQAEGWQLLFDGKDLSGWRGIGMTAPKTPAPFKAEDGMIHKVTGVKGEGDLITDKTFKNFELSFEWKIGEAGNNGVKYNVSEELSRGPKKTGRSALGFEYQVLDDQKASDRVSPKHQAGSLYELKAPDDSKKKLKPVGEWNQSKIVYNGNHIEHWLNGQKIVEAELGTPEMDAALAASKWKNIKDFGKRWPEGRIVITDHESEAWYRNIKIRELPGK